MNISKLNANYTFRTVLVVQNLIQKILVSTASSDTFSVHLSNKFTFLSIELKTLDPF